VQTRFSEGSLKLQPLVPSPTPGFLQTERVSNTMNSALLWAPALPRHHTRSGEKTGATR